MSVQSMSSVLEQIKLQAGQTSGISNVSSLRANQETQEASGFSAILSNSLHNVNQMQVTARNQAQDYLTGKPGVGLNDVMVSLQKSSIALNLGVQVRNKLVSAYQEIMSMAV